ncbi:MAG TPA: beta-propeller fold lactonase family protein, partial [Anaerolineae bacterium]|nr:beta-propeller fold lactonase family protein [Anaerolineae bacterium]
MSARARVTAAIVLIVVIMAGGLNLIPAAWAAPQAAPVTITVNTLQDKIDPNDSKCSLREAMQRAFDNAINNTLPNDCPQSPSGFTTIKFSVSGTIVITNGVDGGQLPNIINTVTLQGPITLDLGKADQIVLDVESSGRLNLINMTIKNAKWTALDTRGEVNIANVTFENNGAGGAGGGAIRNDGKAVIAGSKFINNRAVNSGMEGGAIRTTWDLSCAGCTFTGNTADKNGGAIALKAGRLEIVDSTFTGNVVKGSLLPSAYGEGGGAIYTSASGNVYPMTIKRSTFSGNYASEGVGGAIFHNADVELTVTDSSFQGNGAGSPSALGSGGAIRNIRPLIVKRSMFIANSVLGDGGAISNDYAGQLTLRLVGFVGNTASVKGGAIANLNGSSSDAKISVIGASLTGNIADSQGGGIYNHESKYDKAEFRLSVWAGNLPQNCRDKEPGDDSNPPPGVDKQPPIDSKGQNSFSDDSCASDDPTDEKNPDPKLDPPAPNGGLIPGLLTQKPKPDSPLVDAIDPAVYPTNDPDVGNQDVRGLPRPMNGDGIGLPLFDIGPFELDDASPEFSSLPAAPGPINLGTFQVGNTYTKTDALKVYIGGAADLTISNVAIGGVNAADFKLSGMPATLSYLGSSNVAISCTPGGNGQRSATLSFNTNDPDHASVNFNLQCIGQTPAAAGFDSTPLPPGPIGETITLGTDDPFFLIARETGNAPLTLSNPSFVSSPSGAITLDTAFPINIANGGAPVPIQFTCVANSIGLRTATFSFNTNDPAHPTVSYNLNCTVNKAKDKFIAAHQSTNAGLGSTAGPYGVTVSPDGKQVYVADAGDSALVAFTVANDYTLLPLDTYHSSALPANDQFAIPLQVLASPDGQNVYITGNGGDSIATYARDADTGALTHLDSVHNGDNYGCLPLPCAGSVTGLDGAYGIALSPDGKFAYISSVNDDSVVVLGRNKTTGGLVDLLGGPMFRQQFTNANLNSAYGLAVSPDGKNVYVTGYTSDALLTLKRDAGTGQVSFVQVLSTTTASGLNGVFRVIVSPDGNFVYTAAYDSDSICTFKRSAVAGVLTWSSCVSSAVYANAASDVTLMPDGKHLLASAYNSDGVAVFERNTHSGFINQTEIITRGATTPWLDGARGVVAHPSGKAAYATGYLDDAVVTLRVGNPLPILTTLSPASRVAGS